MKIKQRIKELEEIIPVLDTLFELGEECINPLTGEVITDNEYDGLKRELMLLEPNSKVFKTITTSKVSAKNKILHDPPMTSIAKCNGTEEEKENILKKWFIDCFPDNPKDIPNSTPDASISYKIDGIACSIIYEKGILICAGLRSKSGEDGTNVTDKMKYIKYVPEKLPLPISCTIRGELVTLLSDFKRISDKLGVGAKVNARAQTSGSMMLKTAEEIKDRCIQFMAYNILNLKNPPYKTEVERAKWANQELGIRFVQTTHFSKEKLKKLEYEYKKLDYMTDGIVLSLNNLENQLALGHSGGKKTGDPKGKIAWKFKDEIKKVTVKEIVWQTGKSSAITPILVFDGIEIEGTVVQRCTGHNVSIIKNNKIGVGSEIEIIKSGKIIPKLHKVIKAKGELDIPSHCPSCGYATKIKNGNDGAQSLICMNKNNLCSAQNIKKFNHFLTTLGCKGIAESTIEKLIDGGLLKQFADFYDLRVDTLVAAGFTYRTALLIVARVNMIHEPEQIKEDILLEREIEDTIHNKELVFPMDKFFASLGIEGAGNSTGTILSQIYGDWNKIISATEEELKEIDGIGPISAKEIVSYFKEHKEEIADLVEYIVFEAPKSSGKLKGKTFVLSGKLDGGGKSFWKNKIEEQSGIIKGSVGKSVSYLVAGSGSGEKSEKARKLGIEIIDVKKLEVLLK